MIILANKIEKKATIEIGIHKLEVDPRNNVETNKEGIREIVIPEQMVRECCRWEKKMMNVQESEVLMTDAVTSDEKTKNVFFQRTILEKIGKGEWQAKFQLPKGKML